MTLIDDVVDSIECPEYTGHAIPSAILHATAIVAYQFGNSWPTFGPYSRARPDLAAKGWIVSTTLTCDGPARMYDIEDGGGRVENIGRFMEQADRTWGLPWLYTFASNAENMYKWAEKFGYHRGRDYYSYLAHPESYAGKHICGIGCSYPPADGTQYTFNTPGNCDTGIINAYMLPGAKPPILTRGDDMITFFVNAAKHDEYGYAEGDEVLHQWKQDDGSWHDEASLGHPGTDTNPIVGITSGVNSNGHDQYGVRLRDGTVKQLWKLNTGAWNTRSDGGFAWEVRRGPR